MRAPVFATLCGPRRLEGRDRAIEAVIKEARAATGGKLLVVNLDTEARWPASANRPSREGLFRYARSVIFGDTPYIGRNETREVFTEMLRRGAMGELEGWTALVIADDPRAASLDRVMDAIAFFNAGDSRFVPWLFPILREIRERSSCPCCVTVVDEPRIEKAAEFFVLLNAELRNLIGKDIELAFNSCIAFDPEKAALCAAKGLSYTDFFSKEETHGQAKAVAARILGLAADGGGGRSEDTLRTLIEAAAC